MDMGVSSAIIVSSMVQVLELCSIAVNVIIWIRLNVTHQHQRGYEKVLFLAAFNQFAFNIIGTYKLTQKRNKSSAIGH